MIVDNIQKVNYTEYRGATMIRKYRPIKDEPLLKTYRNTPCFCCRTDYGTSAHHHVTRAKQRMDVVENLTAMCEYCHGELTHFPDGFKMKYGQQKYDFLNKLKDGHCVDSIYDLYKR